jgi:hypothetical protein
LLPTNFIIASSIILEIFSSKLLHFVLFLNLIQNYLVPSEQFLGIIVSIVIISETAIATIPAASLEIAEIVILRRLVAF